MACYTIKKKCNMNERNNDKAQKKREQQKGFEICELSGCRLCYPNCGEVFMQRGAQPYSSQLASVRPFPPSSSSRTIHHLPVLPSNRDPRSGQQAVPFLHIDVPVGVPLGRHDLLQLSRRAVDGEREPRTHVQDLLALGGHAHASGDGYSVEVRLWLGAWKMCAGGDDGAHGGRGEGRGHAGGRHGHARWFRWW